MAIAFSSSSLKIAKSGNFRAKFEVLSAYMKFCMNLNLRAEKQNYYLTSLNYVVTVAISVSVLKWTIIFSRKNSYFLRLLFAFTKILVFNYDQISEREK